MDGWMKRREHPLAGLAGPYAGRGTAFALGASPGRGNMAGVGNIRRGET